MPPDGAAEPGWFLVTGGSGGIGAAVCEALAARGVRPVVGYCRARERARAVAARSAGLPLELDLTSADSILAAVAELERLPRLLGVVLAAAPAPELSPFGKISPASMARHWQAQVSGPQQLLAELVRRCLRKQRQGCVVGVLTSAMGDSTRAAASGMGAYVIAKHGLAGVLLLLAADYPWLRVRTVRPGFTETRMLEVFDERFLAQARAHADFSTPAAVAKQIMNEAFAC